MSMFKYINVPYTYIFSPTTKPANTLRMFNCIPVFRAVNNISLKALLINIFDFVYKQKYLAF